MNLMHSQDIKSTIFLVGLFVSLSIASNIPFERKKKKTYREKNDIVYDP